MKSHISQSCKRNMPVSHEIERHGSRLAPTRSMRVSGRVLMCSCLSRDIWDTGHARHPGMLRGGIVIRVRNTIFTTKLTPSCEHGLSHSLVCVCRLFFSTPSRQTAMSVSFTGTSNFPSFLP